MFGHCNTYLVQRMTGRWAIDPSTTSITGLYNTARNDLTWNREILDLAGIPQDRLPPLMQSYEPGRPAPAPVADELGLPRDCSVLCGGNDATLAALSGGLTEPGDINIISGTCDIANVCTDRPIASPNFNVRCHVLPGRWLTFFVLNTGGEALEWFRGSPAASSATTRSTASTSHACSTPSSGIRTRMPAKPSCPSTCRTSAAAGTPSSGSRPASTV